MQLGRLRLSSFWLILLGLAIQTVAMGYIGRSWAGAAAYRPEIIIGSYVLVLIGLWRNVRVPGMQVVALGFLLNFLVIVANGGGMPVSYETLQASGQGYLVANQQPGQYVAQSKDVLLPRESARLWWLGDIFVTPPPVTRAASLGDFATYLGVAIVIVFAMRQTGGPVRMELSKRMATGA